MALQKIDVTEALKKVDEALEKIATRMRGGGNVDKELVANILTKIRKVRKFALCVDFGLCCRHSFGFACVVILDSVVDTFLVLLVC